MTKSKQKELTGLKKSNFHFKLAIHGIVVCNMRVYASASKKNRVYVCFFGQKYMYTRLCALEAAYRKENKEKNKKSKPDPKDQCFCMDG